MSDLNQVLSQEEIDALVAKNVSKPPPPHTIVSETRQSNQIKNPESSSKININSAPVQTVKVSNGPHSHHEECIAAGNIKNIEEHISNLSARLEKLEAIVSKLDNKPQTYNEINPSQLKSTIQQIKNISSQIEIITQGLRGTAGYNLNKLFKCNSCGAMGFVAIKVRCNQCGKENWWGWFPKKK